MFTFTHNPCTVFAQAFAAKKPPSQKVSELSSVSKVERRGSVAQPIRSGESKPVENSGISQSVKTQGVAIVHSSRPDAFSSSGVALEGSNSELSRLPDNTLNSTSASLTASPSPMFSSSGSPVIPTSASQLNCASPVPSLEKIEAYQNAINNIRVSYVGDENQIVLAPLKEDFLELNNEYLRKFFSAGSSRFDFIESILGLLDDREKRLRGGATELRPSYAREELWAKKIAILAFVYLEDRENQHVELFVRNALRLINGRACPFQSEAGDVVTKNEMIVRIQEFLMNSSTPVHHFGDMEELSLGEAPESGVRRGALRVNSMPHSRDAVGNCRSHLQSPVDWAYPVIHFATERTQVSVVHPSSNSNPFKLVAGQKLDVEKREYELGDIQSLLYELYVREQLAKLSEERFARILDDRLSGAIWAIGDIPESWLHRQLVDVAIVGDMEAGGDPVFKVYLLYRSEAI